MRQHIVHNFIWFPIFLIGLVTLALGLIWVCHPEPWLLDQPPNEALIQTTFKNLFSLEINKYLPSYLKVVYQFLGLWLITIGLLILAYVKVTRLATAQARNAMYFIMLITLFGIFYLVFTFLPTSPLIPTIYILGFLLICSLGFSTQLDD